jgi:polar amino acid transport system substrate-binding protein
LSRAVRIPILPSMIWNRRTDAAQGCILPKRTCDRSPCSGRSAPVRGLFSWLLSLLLILSAGNAGAEPARLLLLTEENPPSNFTDPTTGRPTGLAVEKLQLILADTGIAHEFRVLPWQRAFRLAETEPNACIFLINPSEDRRPLFQWVEPLMRGGWALFALADWPGRVDGPADLARYSISVQAGGPVEKLLRQLAEPHGGVRLDSQPGVANFARLKRGDVDLYASGFYAAPYQAAKEGISLRLVYRLTESIGSMACNLKMEPALVARMQAALDRINADGRARKIEAKYHGNVLVANREQR